MASDAAANVINGAALAKYVFIITCSSLYRLIRCHAHRLGQSVIMLLNALDHFGILTLAFDRVSLSSRQVIDLIHLHTFA
jgi:hypothetical protein